MGTIKALAKGLRSVKLAERLPKMLLDEKEFAIEENQAQLLEGRTSEGASGVNLLGYSNFDYAVKKNKMNSLPEFGVPDLKFNGDFYKGFDLKTDATEYTLFSNDDKSLELEEKYTKYIFGLQIKNKQAWAKVIYKNQIIPYIQKQTGLKFR